MSMTIELALTGFFMAVNMTILALVGAWILIEVGLF